MDTGIMNSQIAGKTMTALITGVICWGVNKISAYKEKCIESEKNKIVENLCEQKGYLKRKQEEIDEKLSTINSSKRKFFNPLTLFQKDEEDQKLRKELENQTKTLSEEISVLEKRIEDFRKCKTKKEIRLQIENNELKSV